VILASLDEIPGPDISGSDIRAAHDTGAGAPDPAETNRVRAASIVIARLSPASSTRLFTLTNRVELEPMTNQLVPERIGNLLLKLLNGLIAELNDVAAVDVDKMIMVLGRDLLVTGTPIAEVMTIENIGFLEQFDRAVNRGNRDPLIMLRCALINLLDIRMISGIGKYLSDDPTLVGHLEPFVYTQLFKA
jgi:hypothetical protein